MDRKRHCLYFFQARTQSPGLKGNASFSRRWTASFLLGWFTCLGPGAFAATLAWDANTEPDLSGYKIYYGGSSRSYSSVTNVGNVTSWTLNGLTNGVPYFFAVTAYSSTSQESDFSNEIQFTPAASTNHPPSITGPGTQTINEDGATATLPVVIQDAETPAASLLVTANSSNGILIPNSNIVLGGSGSNRTVQASAAPNQSGSATITLSVSDGTNSTQTSFLVNVNAVNDPPTISSISSRTVNEDANTGAIAFTIGDSETAAGSLTLSAASSNPALVPAANMVFGGSGSNRTVTVSPAPNQFGTANLTLTVNDGSLSNSMTFLLTVNAVNDPPTLNSLTNLSIAADAGPRTVNLSGISSGATNEFQSLTVTASSSDPNLIPNPSVTYSSPGSTGTLTLAPATNLSGTATISVTVNDNQATNNLFTRTFNVTVNAVNHAPTISSIVNQAINEDGSAGPVAFTVGDAETAASSLLLSASSSNQILVPSNGISFGGSGSNRNVTVSPAPNQSGTSVITVTVGDGSLSTSTNFTLTVTAVNDAPTLDPIPNWTISSGAGPQTVNLTGISSGATNETQTLTITATSTDPALIPDPIVSYTSPAATGSLTFNPATNTNGTATITVTVGDGQAQNGTVTRSFNVTLTASASTNLYLEAESGALVAPMTIASDTNASSGRYVYSPTNSQGTVSFTFDAPTAADYYVWCRILSPNSGTDSFFVSMDGTAEDIYGTAQNAWSPNWQWSRLNGESLGNPRILTLASGTHTLTFRSRESRTFLDALYITADPAFLPSPITTTNRPPTLDPISNLSMPEDSGSQSIVLSGITSGATNENQMLSVSATSSNPSLIPNPAVDYVSPETTGSLTLSPVSDGSGTATITVTVNDGQSASNTFSRSFVVTVNAVNDGPAISKLLDQTINQDESTGPINFAVTDPDTSSTNLTVSASSSDQVLVPNSNISLAGSGRNRTVSISPASGRSGTATITLTVSDGSLSAATAFDLIVNPVGGGGISVFSNVTTIAIADNGRASPYPSTINVSGVNGNLSSLQVSINGLTHTWPDDIDVLLVAPNGQKVVILSDVGGGNPVSNVNLVLADGAAAALPDQAPLISGQFRPTNFGTNDIFASPAPAGPYASVLASLNGISPNGTWSLYVMDDAAVDTGSIKSWSLTIDTGTPSQMMIPGTQASIAAAAAMTAALPPPALTIVNRRSDGSVTLRVDDASMQKYTLEASDNLRDWKALGIIQSGTTLFPDAEGAGKSERFYRIWQNP